jgi:hypothetical protein
MLLLPEGRKGGAWEASKAQCSVGKRTALDKKVLLLALKGLDAG